ncbi:hypothetical protein ACHAXT_006823 [Thalassiosira profunda]
MVFFCCDGCGETFKMHMLQNAVTATLSVVLNEYRNHTTCISEAERYEKTIYRGARKLDDSGTGHRQHQHNGKKLTPQEKWNQTIQIAAETSPPGLKSYMNQLAMQENEKQFRNFAANSLRLKGPNGEKKAIGEIWALLFKAREEEKQKQLAEEEAKKKAQEAKTPKISNKSKAASVSSDDNNSDESSPKLPSEKQVTKAIKKVLKQAPKKQMKFKALRKRVQESLAFKADKSGKKKWKKLVQQCVDANSKRLLVDGKTVTLKK